MPLCSVSSSRRPVFLQATQSRPSPPPLPRRKLTLNIRRPRWQQQQQQKRFGWINCRFEDWCLNRFELKIDVYRLRVEVVAAEVWLENWGFQQLFLLYVVVSLPMSNAWQAMWADWFTFRLWQWSGQGVKIFDFASWKSSNIEDELNHQPKQARSKTCMWSPLRKAQPIAAWAETVEIRKFSLTIFCYSILFAFNQQKQNSFEWFNRPKAITEKRSRQNKNVSSNNKKKTVFLFFSDQKVAGLKTGWEKKTRFKTFFFCVCV